MMRHAPLGFVLLLLSVASWSQSESSLSSIGEWQAGKHYQLLKPSGSRHSMRGKVEVLEFFGYKCPHCDALEPTIAAWAAQKPYYIEFTRVPIGSKSAWGAYARLYYTLKALHREDLHQEVFDTVHKRGTPLATRDPESGFHLQLAFATAHGIKAEDFTKAYRSSAVDQDMESALETAARYQISGVPAVVVADKYLVDPGMVANSQQLIAVVAALAAAEHQHRVAQAE